MDILGFIGTVVVVTASGALSPGPLFVATISSATRNGPRSGILAAVGHTLAELPIVLLLSAGLLQAVNNLTVRNAIGLVGGIALILFGALQIGGSLRESTTQAQTAWRAGERTPLLVGVFFTALNPFFIVWWITLGSALILQALLIGSILGVLLMYAAHVWMDYAWLGLVAYLSHRGSRVMNRVAHRILIITLGILMVYFGFNFIVSSISPGL